MKTMIGAIALALALPALAQQPPATDPHAGHAQHDKAKHDCNECCEKMKGASETSHAGRHDVSDAGKMECMDKKGETKPASPAPGDHEGHAGHAH